MPRARNESKPKNKVYQLFLINHGKKIRTLYVTDSMEKALSRMKELEEESKNVKFPIKWNNEKTEIIPSEYEVVLAKYGQGIGAEPSMLRNEFGKFVNYSTESKDSKNNPMTLRKHFGSTATILDYSARRILG